MGFGIQGGVNYDTYGTWEKVVAPSGQTYYKVPETGYLFDPFLSNTKGRPILFTDPRPQQQAQQNQIDQQNKAAKQAASPINQYGPIAAGATGVVAAKIGYDEWNKWRNPSTTPNSTPANTASTPGTPTPQLPPASSGGTFTGADIPEANFPTSGAEPVTVAAGQPVPDGYKVVGGDAGGGSQLAVPSDQVAADGTISSNVNLAPYLYGAAALYQLYGAYKQYKEGDIVGAGLSTAGAVTAGAAAAQSAGAIGATGTGATVAAAAPYVAIAAQAYNSFQAYRGAKKASKGGGLTDDEITSIHSPYHKFAEKFLGKEIGGIGLKGDPQHIILKSLFGSTKPDDQLYRDRVRKAFQDAGFVDKDWNLTLADGSKFDIGKDGKSKAYQVDLKNPNASLAIGDTAPLAAILTGGQKKLSEDFNGYFANAALSNGDPRANALAIYKNAGIVDKNQAFDAVAQLEKDERLTPELANIYRNSLNNLYGGAQPPGQTQSAPLPARSSTSSPGISTSGQRISYDSGRLGQALARRINSRGR